MSHPRVEELLGAPITNKGQKRQLASKAALEAVPLMVKDMWLKAQHVRHRETWPAAVDFMRTATSVDRAAAERLAGARFRQVMTVTKGLFDLSPSEGQRPKITRTADLIISLSAAQDRQPGDKAELNKLQRSVSALRRALGPRGFWEAQVEASDRLEKDDDG